MLKFILQLIVLIEIFLFTPTNAKIQTIDSTSSKFNQIYRPLSKNTQNVVELKIDSTILIDETKIYDLPRIIYCLGGTDIKIKTFGEENTINSADSLLNLRDLMKKSSPGKVQQFFSYFSGNGKNSKSSSSTDQSAVLNEYTTKLTISPYEQKFLGIQSDHPCEITINRRIIKIKNLLLLVASILLFINAGKIARQAATYYVSGVSISIILGAVILFYFLMTKILPKGKSIFIAGLVSTVPCWLEYFFVGFVRQALVDLCQAHWFYVVGYFLVFGTLGFIGFGILEIDLVL